MKKLKPPLKWHGGKHYLATRIVELMPPHLTYVEPFAGGLAVLLAKPATGAEIVNDLDGRLTNFWRVLQEEHLFARFVRRVQAIPFSEAEWIEAGARLATQSRDPLDAAEMVDRAIWFFVYCRQSRAGQMRDFATLTRNRLRRGMNEQASAWLTAVDGLPAVHARLCQVAILYRPALDVIRQLDGPDTLFYLDPPYLHETRATPDAYAIEMNRDEHAELLDALRNCRGKVMLSGYPSDLYERKLTGWRRVDFDLPNNAAGGTEKRRMTEALWCNFAPKGNGK